jgi:hypothetical protein
MFYIRLTCNYVKYRTEAVREISWYVGYSGFSTKIFTYRYRKEIFIKMIYFI